MSFLIPLCGLLALLQEPPDALSEEQRSIFETIDKLDPFDSSKFPFVKFFNGRIDKDHPEGPRPHSYDGFLLKDAGDTFTIRYLDLDKATFTRTVKGTPEMERVHYVPADLAEYARSLAKEFKETDEEDRRFYLGMDGIFNPHAEALLVARACARRGMRREVRELWNAVDLDKAVDGVAAGFQHRLEIDFADPDLTWSQLRDRHRTWIDTYEFHKRREYVEPDLEMLDRMIKEDEERKTKRPAGTPSQAEEIAGLIFDLRNERWAIEKQYWDGHYLGGEAPKSDGSRPSERLIKIGFDATPALIESLADSRFTRIVWYSSRYGGGYRVKTVGSLVEEVLQEISGLSFYGKEEERKEAWNTWRTSVATKGEEETLAGMAAEGGDHAVQAAEVLIKKWPKRIKEILKGIRKVKEAHQKIRMLELLKPLREEAVTTFLLEELKKGTETEPRVAAARLLLERGRRDGIDILVQEWTSPVEFKETTQKDLPPEIMEFDKRIRQTQAREAMSKFLLTSGDLRAFRAVTKDVMAAPIGLRKSVLGVLWASDLMEELLQRCDAKGKGDLERAIEEVLIGFLDDKHRNIGSSYGAITSPRHADLAALGLADHWPKVYPFDAKAPSRQRDRRMKEMIHAWRTRNGKDSVAPPPAPDLRSKDPEIAKRVERFIAEPKGDLRKTTGDALEAAGLGALPWIEEGIRKLPANHPASADLKAVAGRLANRIGGTKLDAGTWKDSAPVQALLSKMEGKALTAESAVQLMLDAMAALPDKAGTVTLTIDRLGDGTGIHIELAVVPGEDESGKSGSKCYSVTIGGESHGFSSGNGVRSVYDDVDDFGDFRKSLAKALASPHDCTFEALIELEFN